MKKIKPKKKRKVLVVVKEWLHTNCKKGEIMEVFATPKVIVISKIKNMKTKAITMTWDKQP